ncbi:MAG: hypothetical protein KF862_13640, partial [Chitinophagaceae bacterium]|nr:hypothetical protein [Chitinophagaceae bacterium]
PWLVVLIALPDPGAVVKQVGLQQLALSNTLSVCWGIANVLYLVCVVKIGAALTGAVLSAAGLCVGVTIPMILKGSGLFNHAADIFSPAGIVIIIGLIAIIIGIVFVSKAGFGREKVLKQNSDRPGSGSGNFLQGLLLVILAGFLSSGLSLAFVYGQGPVIEAAKAQGASDLTANITVWAFCALGGGLVNVGYALYLMAKHRSWKKLFERKDELLYGSIIGLQFIIAVILLGRGMLLLGALGASIGFAIQQSLQVIGNQLVGFWGGEWKGVHGLPRKNMYIAITVILLAVVILAYSNTL